MEEFSHDHPIREGAILRCEMDGERVEVLVEVVSRYEDLDDGHYEYEVSDPTHTGYYQYHERDVDDIFSDTGLTNEEPKPIMDDEIRELYRRLHEHSWTDARDKDTGEVKDYCMHCRTFRSELSRGEWMADKFGGDPEDYESEREPPEAPEDVQQVLDSFNGGDRAGDAR